jgi:transcriptional regulator with XRE-family HTH domain
MNYCKGKESKMSLFGTPGDVEYERLVAENVFINDIQREIEEALDFTGTTQAELARRLGVSEARISQILSDNGANLQARTIARIAHAVGMSAALIFEETIAARQVEVAVGDFKDGNSFAEWVRIASETVEREREMAGAVANSNDWSGVRIASSLAMHDEELVAA